MYEEKVKKEFDWKGIILKVALAIVVLILVIKLLPLDNKKTTVELSTTFKTNMSTLKESGKAYFNEEKLPKNVGEKSKVSLGDLISEGEVRELKDAEGTVCDLNNSYVQVTKTVNNYELEVNLICGDENDTQNDYLGTINTTKTTTTTEATTTTKKPSNNKPSNNNNNNNNNNGNSGTSTQKKTTTIAKPSRYSFVFNVAGGTPVQYQYVNAGARANMPANPTKTGYYFAGWYFQDRVFDFNTPITKNMIVIAKWVPVTPSGTTVTTKTTTTTKKTTTRANNTNSLTVYFKDQYSNYINNGILTLYNGDCLNRSCSSYSSYATWSTISSQNPFLLTSLPTGYYTIAQISTPNGYETASKVLVYIGSTSYNYSQVVYSTKKTTTTTTTTKSDTVKIYFDSNGGSTLSTKTINYGTYLAQPSNPTRSNAVFQGWYYNNQKFNFNTTRIYDNITLKAKWLVTETYNVDVYSIGWGTKVSTIKTNHTLAIPTALKDSQYKNVRIKNNGLSFNRSLSTSADLTNYDKYRNITFEGYIANGWEYTTGIATNFAKINSATITKASSGTYDRNITWTGNVGSQCNTSFNYNGVKDACLYGITYRVIWEYEIER